MSDLNKLLVVKGVIAALHFSDDGSLAESVGELDRTHANLLAAMCYANGRIMHQGGDILMALSGTGGWPPHGWMTMGGKLSVCAVSDVVCIVSNDEVSFNAVFRALAELTHPAAHPPG